MKQFSLHLQQETGEQRNHDHVLLLVACCLLLVLGRH